MSIALMTAAFKTQLHHTHKFVFIALCDNANDQGECYPAISTLCKKTSLSVRAVQKSISYLALHGYLKQKMRNGRSTYYFITDPGMWFTPEQCAPLHEVHHTSAHGTPPPPHEGHQTPAGCAPRTVTEPKKLLLHAINSGSSSQNDFYFPKELSEREKNIVTDLVKNLDRAIAQNVIDEAIGLKNKGAIRNSFISVITGLVKNVKTGNFIPATGIEVSKNRGKELANLASLKATSRVSEIITPPSKIVVSEEIEKAKKLLKIREKGHKND